MTRTTTDPHDRLTLAAELPQQLGLLKKIKVIVGSQVHGKKIAYVSESDTQTDNPLIEIPAVDAIVTRCHNILIGVFTADCVPIVLCEPERGMIAVVHAGRLGTELKLVRSTIKKMQEQNCSVEQITAWIAPSICAKHYQVSQQMAENFRKIFPQYQNIIHGPEKRHLALAQTNRLEIISCGVPPNQITLDARCTFENKNTLHSYRRDSHQAGRMLTYIGWIDSV